MTDIVGSARVIITPDTTAFAGQLGKSMTGFGASLGTVGRSLTSAITLPIGLATAGVVKFGTEFDTAIRTAATIAGVDVTLIGKDIAGMEEETALAAKTMETLEAAALDLGTKGRLGPVAVAEGFTELSRAGINANDIVAASTPILNLATAEQISFAEASEKAINVFAGYGGALQNNANLSEELTHTIDVLAETSNMSTTSITELTDAFRYAGPVASGMGIDFEETAAALGILANAGFKGSLGGTALRGTLVRLALASGETAERLNSLGIASEDAMEELTKTELDSVEKQLRDMGLRGEELRKAMDSGAGGAQAASQALSKLGVSVFDAEGNMIPLTKTLQLLSDNGATTADVMAIFGQRAGPGMAALLQRGGDELAEWTKNLEGSSGAAAKLAEGILSGPEGSFARLKNTLQAFAIAISESGVLAGIGNIAASLTHMVDSLRNVDPQILKFVSTFLLILAALGPVLLLMDKFRLAFIALKGALLLFSGPVGATVAAIAAVIAIFVLAYKNSEDLQEALSQLGDVIGRILAPIWSTFNSLLETGGNKLAELAEAFGDFLAGPVSAFAGWLDNAVTQLGELWDALSSGEDAAQNVAEVIDNMFGSTGALIEPISTLVTVFEDWWAVMEVTGETLSTLTTISLKQLTDGLSGLWDAIQLLVSGDFSGFADAFMGALGQIGTAVTSFAIFIPHLILASFTNLVTTIATAFADVPILGPLLVQLANIGTEIEQAVGNVGTIFQTIFSDSLSGDDKLQFIKDFALRAARSFGTIITEELPKSLGNIGSYISGPLADGLQDALTDAVGMLGGTPLEGLGDAIATGLPDVARSAGDALAGFGDVIAGIPEFLQSVGEAAEIYLLPALREIGSAAGPILGALGAVVRDDLIPAFQDLWPIFQNVAQIAGTLFAGAVVILTNAFAGFLDSGGLEFIVSAIGSLGDAFRSAVEAVRGFTDVIAGLLSGDMEQVRAGLVGMADGLLEYFTTILADIPGAITDLVVTIGDTIFGAFENVPFIGEAFETLKQVLDEVGGMLSGIFDVIGGIFSMDVGRISAGIQEFADSFLRILLEAFTAIPELLGDIISDGVPVIAGALSGIGEWLQTAFSEVPIIGELFDELGNIVSSVGDALSGIFDIIGGIVTLDFGRVLDGLKTLGGALLDAVGGILANVPQLLADLAVLLFDGVAAAFGAAWNWISTDGLQLFMDAWDALPGAIVGLLTSLGGTIIDGLGTAFGFIKDTLGPTILDALQILGPAILDGLSAALDWVVQNIGPAVLAVAQYWNPTNPDGLFLTIVGYIAFAGIVLWEAFFAALGFITENIGSWISTAADFFNPLNPESLWVRIIELAGAAGSALWGGLQTALTAVTDGIHAWMDTAVELFNPLDPESIWQRAVRLATGAGETLWNGMVTAFDWIEEKIREWIGRIVYTWNPLNPDGLIQRAIRLFSTAGSTLWNGLVTAFDFVKDKISDAIAFYANFFNPFSPTGLVQMAISAAANMGTQLWNSVLSPAFDFVKEKISNSISNIADFFSPSNPDGLIAKIKDFADDVKTGFLSIGTGIANGILEGLGAAAGFVTDFADTVWTAIKDLINVNIIDKLNAAIPDSIGVGPLNYDIDPTPIPQLAQGGIFSRATPAIIGEAGAEVVVPLTNTARALELAEKSGLAGMILAGLAQRRISGGNAAMAAAAPTIGMGRTAAPMVQITTSGATGGTTVLERGGGDTYNIYGVSPEQVIAKIQAERDASARRIRR